MRMLVFITGAPGSARQECLRPRVLGNALKNAAAPHTRRLLPGRGCYGIDGDAEFATSVLARLAPAISSAGIRIEGASVAELGPGRTPHLLAGLVLAGAESGAGFDVLRQIDDVPRAEHFAPLASLLAGSGEAANVFREELGVEADRATSRCGTLGAMPITMCAYDGTALPAPDGSIDVVFSKSVMEHVPHDEVGALLADTARVLRPGGVSAHVIDLRDHLFIDGDERVTGDWLTALRYPERLFRLMFSRRSSYINRLRASEWRAAFERAGFTITHWDEQCFALPADFDARRLHARWRHLPRAELEVGFLVVGATVAS